MPYCSEVLYLCLNASFLKGITGPDLTGNKLKDALQHLQDCIDARESGKRDEGLAEVFITFNEAHPLTVPFKNGGESNFVELRQALQMFRMAPLPFSSLPLAKSCSLLHPVVTITPIT